MKGFWKNEVRFFFSKKNCLVLVLGLLAMTGIFWFSYEKQYKSFDDDYTAYLEMVSQDVNLWSQRYSYRLEQLQLQYPGHEDTEEAILMAKVWKDYYDNLRYLLILWQHPEENEERIRQVEEEMDEALLPVYEMEVETGETGLYRQYPRQWSQRRMLRKAYTEPLRWERPDGVYVVSDALSGSRMAGLVLLIMVLALNFDIWAKDFENETDRLLFTLPHSKAVIYINRFLARFLLTTAGVLLCILVLFGWGTFCHGSGLERMFTVYQPAIHTISFFAEQKEVLITTDVVVSATSYLLHEILLFLVYIFFIFSCVQLVSFLGKSQMLAILVCFIGSMAGILALILPKESYVAGGNLFAYLQWEQLKEGALGVSFGMAGLLLFVGGCLLLLVALGILRGKLWNKKNSVD